MHCKDISVRDVTFPLTVDGISEAMRSWRAYRRAEYVVLRNGDDLAVVRLEKRETDDLFEDVVSFEIISLPFETVFTERPDVNVLNLTAMARIQREYPGKAVVVRGLFAHVSFMKGLEALPLRVVDIVPPTPSKMRYLVELALSTGYVDLPVVPEYIENDIVKMSEKAETEEVMFPCEVSGASVSRPYCFLDQVPDISGKDLTLVGCRLSKRIFSEHYGVDVPFINVCPRDAVTDEGVKTLVKCCHVREGHKLEGNIASVPWGVTVPEIVDAINDLFRDAQ